jgi:hypothetical protein
MRILALLVLVSVSLHGGIVYEVITTTEGLTGAEITESTTIFYIDGECRRKENTIKNPMTGEETVITITRLDKHVMWTLDMDHQQYTEIKLTETPLSEEKNEDIEESKLPEIIIEKTGQKKEILSKICEEVIISMKLLTEDDNLTVTQTMWVSQDIKGSEEIQEFNEKFSSFNPRQTSVWNGTESLEKFQENIKKIEGFPLELSLDIDMGNLVIKSHSIVTRIETKPIHEKVFEIPEGFVCSE